MPEEEHHQPTVVITGSSGLIGSAVVERLARDHRVIGWDVKPPNQPLPDNAEFHEVDLTDDHSVAERVREVHHATGGRVASIIHLAAYYDFSGEPSPLYDKVTVRGSERLLKTLQKQGTVVEQFLFSSTMLVHAPTVPGEPITEDHPIDAKWDYPQSKVDTETLLRREHGDVPLVLLRVAGVYTDACDSIPIAQQMARIYENRMTSHVFPGDPSHGQAFVHLEDLVDAIAAAVQRRGSLPKEIAILIGEPETYSYETLQRELARLIHSEDRWTRQPVPKALAKTGAWVQGHIPGVEEPFIKPWMIDLADDHYELDIGRARLLLDWEPRHRLLNSLPAMVEALKRDPVAWYERHDIEVPAEVRQRT